MRNGTAPSTAYQIFLQHLSTERTGYKELCTYGKEETEDIGHEIKLQCPEIHIE